jgi:hypothetical protein
MKWLNHDLREPISVPHAMAVDRLQSGVASRLFQDDSHMAVTAWTRAGEVAIHQRKTFRIRP